MRLWSPGDFAIFEGEFYDTKCHGFCREVIYRSKKKYNIDKKAKTDAFSEYIGWWKKDNRHGYGRYIDHIYGIQ